jgi:hypothetical protein
MRFCHVLAEIEWWQSLAAFGYLPHLCQKLEIPPNIASDRGGFWHVLAEAALWQDLAGQTNTWLSGCGESTGTDQDLLCIENPSPSAPM